MTERERAARSASIAGASRIDALRRMVEIREVEDRLNELYAGGLIRGSIHTCQGQEAIAVAAAVASAPGDHASATYRGHGVALAFGVTPLAVIAEVLGRRAGSAGGIGGSMHLAEARLGLLPTNAIVGAGIPIAVGAAASARFLGRGGASVAFFGDGATNIGVFHESLNLAAVWRLPVVFVCENNLYGEYSPFAATTAVADIAVRGSANAVRSEIVDGQDLDELLEAMRAAFARGRAGDGPTLIEARTYRYHGHSKADSAAYRPEGELERWLARDPVDILASRLVAEGELTAERLGDLRAEVAEGVAVAVEEALASPAPDPADALAHVSAA